MVPGPIRPAPLPGPCVGGDSPHDRQGDRPPPRPTAADVLKDGEKDVATAEQHTGRPRMLRNPRVLGLAVHPPPGLRNPSPAVSQGQCQRNYHQDRRYEDGDVNRLHRKSFGRVTESNTIDGPTTPLVTRPTPARPAWWLGPASPCLELSWGLEQSPLRSGGARPQRGRPLYPAATQNHSPNPIAHAVSSSRACVGL